ncbi:hypothetical protein ACFOLF_10990 [Paenibacillus sepulcri]|uniref:Uncharacterized protein n=1 Tax=Paenibacillus sepulcri TaxID=359917 RepID=A0ABS7C2L3_9BACL|nr:hypothetical protein [Paenibacillus sepulcri]
MNHTQIKRSKNKRTLWLIGCAIALAVMAGCNSGGNNNTQDNGNTSLPANTDVNNNGSTNSNSGMDNSGSTNNNGSVTDPGTAVPDSGSNNPAPDNANSGSSESPDNGTEGSANTDPAQDTVLKGEGEYVGEVDTHSVEIKMNDTATVFQVDDEVSKQLTSLSDNSNVTYEYIEKDTDVDGEMVKQYWLKSIKQK